MLISRVTKVAGLIMALCASQLSISQGIGASPDSKFTSGKIVYRLDAPSGKTPDSPRIRRTESLLYRPDAYRFERWSAQDRSDLETYIVSKSHVYSVSANTAKSILATFEPSAKQLPLGLDHRFEVMPEPSYPFAAGFGSDGKGWRFGDASLTLRDRTELSMTYQGGDLRSVKRTIKGRTLNEFQYEGALSAGDGIRIPLDTTRLDWVGDPPITTRFHFVHADFTTPVLTKDVEFEWYKPGNKISDQRVDPPVLWTYDELVSASGKKSGLTPEELLVLSQQRANAFRPELARKNRTKVNPDGPSPLTAVVILFVMTFVGSATVMLTRNRMRGR